MSKTEAGKRWYVGIGELMVAISDGGAAPTMESIGNDAAGHGRLQARLRALSAPILICLEASGNYSLDVALVLARETAGWQVSVVNPRLARRFAESLGERSKADPVDARALAQYAPACSLGYVP